MKRVLQLAINGNTVAVYEQTDLHDEIFYTAYHVVSGKRYYIDDFDSLTEAFQYCLQFCYDN